MRACVLQMMAEGPWDNSQLQMKVTKEGHIHEEEICHFGKQISSGMVGCINNGYICYNCLNVRALSICVYVREASGTQRGYI